MAHKNHYAHCGWCGWTGKESELPIDQNHECGKDQCPQCDKEGCISCCYKSYEGAETMNDNDIDNAPQENMEGSKTQQATNAWCSLCKCFQHFTMHRTLPAIYPLENCMKCKCGSYAINPHLHDRDNTDLDLCDVCYWRKRANSTQQLKAEIAALVAELKVYKHHKKEYENAYHRS